MKRSGYSAGKFVDKVNPLNNIGFYVLLGLRVFVSIEFMKSPSGFLFQDPPQ